MKTSSITLVALSAILLGTSAMAQYPGGGPGGGGGRHGGEGGDPSQGGSALTRRDPERAMRPIPRDVFDAQVRAAFAEADLNHDGVVTLDEIRAAREAKREAIINARFAEVDTNHDGSISHAEFMAWQKHMGDPEMAHGERPDGPPPEMGDGGPDAGPRGVVDRRGVGLRGGGMVGFLIAPITANMVVDADTDHDGALSLGEDLAFQDAIFARADANHDGFLDEGELRMARVAREQS